MGNFAYGSGGNSINFGQGLDAITSLMQGFNGSPQQMNANRQFGISEGHLDVDRQKQYFTQGNAIALGERFKEGLPKKPNGFVDAGALPLDAGATAGELSSLASLLGSANREAETKLTLSPWNYAANVFSEAGGDPTKLRLGSEAINYADSLASDRQRRELGNKNDFESQMYSRPNINAGLPQLLVEIEQNPNYTREEKDRFQQIAKSGGSVASAHLDPKLKAEADVFGRQMALDTGVAQRESDIKRAESAAGIIAKSVADQDYLNRSSAPGALEYNLVQANKDPLQRAQFDTDEKIRLKREEAKLGIEYPTTDTAYRVRAAERSGISDLEQYATEVKPVVIPEGGSAMIPQGSYLERNFKPSVDKVALAKQAEDTLTSMTKEELAALPREQLIRLKQAINAGKSAFPEPIKPDSITGRFPTKEEAPKSGELSYNPKNSILLSTKLEKVDPKVDHEFDKLLDAYENVTRAIEATQEYPKAFGNQFSLASKIPFFGESAKNSITEKGETAARSVVFDATSQKKHEIYGAALTGGEQLDANNFLPSGSDSADKVREKLQALQGNLYRVIERRMDTFHPYNQSHFLKSYESGRKMIDPASMTRAQEKNGASNKGSNKNGANINPRRD